MARSNVEEFETAANLFTCPFSRTPRSYCSSSVVIHKMPVVMPAKQEIVLPCGQEHPSRAVASSSKSHGADGQEAACRRLRKCGCWRRHSTPMVVDGTSTNPCLCARCFLGRSTNSVRPRRNSNSRDKQTAHNLDMIHITTT